MHVDLYVEMSSRGVERSAKQAHARHASPLRATVVTFNALLSAYEKACQWQRAEAMLVTLLVAAWLGGGF